MDTKAARALIRQDWEQEAREALDMEMQIEQQLKKWRLGVLFIGLAVVAASATIVPFMAGHALHAQWESVGKKVLLLAMGLFLIFLFVAGMSLNLWIYLKQTRRTNLKYAPPQIRYKKS